MTLAERLLYHQIHPLKVGTVVVAGMLSLALLWQRSLRAGFYVVTVPPATASAVIVTAANLEPYRSSPAGAYLRTYITPLAHLVRYASFGVMMAASWRRNVLSLGVGSGGLAVSWLYGLLPSWRTPV